MMQTSTNQNHYQHQQPISSSTFFFFINNKIRPTSPINTIINIRSMPNSTTKENQHQQKFLFLPHNQHRTSTSTTKRIQQFGDERLAMVEGGWDPEF